MRKKTLALPSFCLSISFAWLLVSASPATAADDTETFVSTLIQNGYFDLAIDYLETVPKSSVASAEFKKAIPYHRGAALAAKSRSEPNPKERARLVERARSQLSDYAQANSKTAGGAGAFVELAQLLRENAAMSLAKATGMPPSSDERTAEWKSARDNYDAAREFLKKAEEAFVAVLATFPKAIPPAEKEKIAQRLAYRGRLAQARLFAARCLHDKSKAYVEGSADAKKLNEQAVKEFDTFIEKYGSFTIGFQATLYQGQAYLALADYKQAIDRFEDVILSAASAPAMRDMVAAAHAYQAEAHIGDKKLDIALDKNEAWLRKFRNADSTKPEWLNLKYQIAQASRIKSELEDTKPGDKRKLLASARDLYRDVAAKPNPNQRAARQILSELMEDVGTLDPTNFAEAYQAAKDALKASEDNRFAAKIAGENNPDSEKELLQAADDKEVEAKDYLELALRLVDDETPVEKLNEARYYLSFIYWKNEDLYRSAILSEFVARRYSNDPMAEMAAKLSLANMEKLYTSASEGGQAEFEGKMLNDMAGFVTRRWPTSETAELAFGVILNFALKENRFAEAQAQINELDEARRPLFQARLGNAMWEAQVKAAASGETPPFDPETVRNTSRSLLELSLPAVAQDSTAAPTLAAASLYLTMAYMNAGQYDKAIALLEDPKKGALALAGTDNPVASRTTYQLEAYKTALRAYVATSPPQTEKAVAMMNTLEKASEELGGGQTLANTYVGIGLQLKQQIDQLNEAGRKEEAERVTKAFAEFLAKIRENSDSLKFPVKQWIAQTYYNLGEGSSDDEARKDYFSKASESFEKLLAAIEADPELAPKPNTKLALQLQLGNALREQGEFAKAIKIFESILTQREMMLDVQKSAAETLLEWGASENGGVDELKQAMSGGTAKGQKGTPAIWGWIKLSQISARAQRQDQRWKPLFYECWINMARTRYTMGLNEKTSAKKNEMYKRAVEVIKAFRQRYPDLGGEKMEQRFDDLMKEIQRTEGKRPTGLNALD